MRLVIRTTVQCAVPKKQLALLLNKVLQFCSLIKTEAIGEELSLAFVGEAAMRRLNETYRQKAESTDVLSFEYGEVIICVPRAIRQAKRHRLSVSREIGVLFLHALLHIFGFDHETEKDRLAMQKAEEKILGSPGLITLQGYTSSVNA
ncbi:rRNA maturation RNase YbeY [Candidatus Uhrbacteria bacterium CG10_big_fil_rev_8_21_14_0_10_48_11]|uniref:Endoribonuclease YbeY n=1 Tax=Candidatus Uhrbacteria bacterium CG10_big_fil_rev_8_21_14_0_10_48_11 TaxID=1975037 RepID=A0A2M8LF71_9BACT|nr:MAG: rRNA maturation RNase YbeY [Candidatus Uhrbacteria bacterium CG10_big_fil_rev_8_21_14_0_10_48_11]